MTQPRREQHHDHHDQHHHDPPTKARPHRRSSQRSDRPSLPQAPPSNIRAVVDEATTKAQKEQLSYQGILAALLLAECDVRDRRSSVRRVKAAGFPRDKWLGDFDFNANPNSNPATINTLPTGD